MIDAGIDFKEVKKAVDYRVGSIVGCLVSHSHKDHSRAVKDVVASAIPVYLSKTDKENSDIASDKLFAVEPLQRYTAGEFSFIPFDVPHDVTCLGFLIHHVECGSVLYITDCYYCPQAFQEVNNALVECNYSYPIIERNYERGIISKKQYDRTMQGHLALETAIELLQRYKASLNNVVLIHLSETNSHADFFREAVATATGKTVHVAERGMIIDFNKTPF
jgi:phosphoribosyl 1,2-cyclic phosphodiesterase